MGIGDYFKGLEGVILFIKLCFSFYYNLVMSEKSDQPRKITNPIIRSFVGFAEGTQDYIQYNRRFVCLPLPNLYELEQIPDELIKQLEQSTQLTVARIYPINRDEDLFCYEVPIDTEALLNFSLGFTGEGIARSALSVFADHPDFEVFRKRFGIVVGQEIKLILLDSLK